MSNDIIYYEPKINIEDYDNLISSQEEFSFINANDGSKYKVINIHLKNFARVKKMYWKYCIGGLGPFTSEDSAEINSTEKFVKPVRDLYTGKFYLQGVFPYTTDEENKDNYEIKLSGDIYDRNRTIAHLYNINDNTISGFNCFEIAHFLSGETQYADSYEFCAYGKMLSSNENIKFAYYSIDNLSWNFKQFNNEKSFYDSCGNVYPIAITIDNNLAESNYSSKIFNDDNDVFGLYAQHVDQVDILADIFFVKIDPLSSNIVYDGNDPSFIEHNMVMPTPLQKYENNFNIPKDTYSISVDANTDLEGLSQFGSYADDTDYNSYNPKYLLGDSNIAYGKFNRKMIEKCGFSSLSDNMYNTFPWLNAIFYSRYSDLEELLSDEINYAISCSRNSYIDISNVYIPQLSNYSDLSDFHLHFIDNIFLFEDNYISSDPFLRNKYIDDQKSQKYIKRKNNSWLLSCDTRAQMMLDYNVKYLEIQWDPETEKHYANSVFSLPDDYPLANEIRNRLDTIYDQNYLRLTLTSGRYVDINNILNYLRLYPGNLLIIGIYAHGTKFLAKTDDIGGYEYSVIGKGGYIIDELSNYSKSWHDFNINKIEKINPDVLYIANDSCYGGGVMQDGAQWWNSNCIPTTLDNNADKSIIYTVCDNAISPGWSRAFNAIYNYFYETNISCSYDDFISSMNNNIDDWRNQIYQHVTNAYQNIYPIVIDSNNALSVEDLSGNVQNLTFMANEQLSNWTSANKDMLIDLSSNAGDRFVTGYDTLKNNDVTQYLNLFNRLLISFIQDDEFEYLRKLISKNYDKLNDNLDSLQIFYKILEYIDDPIYKLWFTAQLYNYDGITSIFNDQIEYKNIKDKYSQENIEKIKEKFIPIYQRIFGEMSKLLANMFTFTKENLSKLAKTVWHSDNDNNIWFIILSLLTDHPHAGYLKKNPEHGKLKMFTYSKNQEENAESNF